MRTETVDHRTLQRLQEAGAVTEVTLVAEPEGWACVVQVRRTQYPLAARRGGVRHWARMETAVRYLRGLGIARFQVDARDYEAIRSQRRRPDAATTLRRIHASARRGDRGSV